MNIFKILSLATTFYTLNKGLEEDGKVTNAEKKVIVKELKKFSKAAIGAIDNLVIPD